MSSRNVISLIDRDIQDRGKDGNVGVTGNLLSAAAYVINTGDLLPKWWSRRRDIELGNMIKRSDHLSGLAYLATTKLASIPFAFKPKDPSIVAHVDRGLELTEQLKLASGMGQTLRQEWKKFIEDYLLNDNGGILEIKGPGRPDGPITGAVQTLRHMDSQVCTRTGDPEFPIKEQRGTKQYKYHWTRVLFLSQNPSGRTNMNGVGFCAASRSAQLGQILKDQINYKMEKMGSRPTTQMIVGENIGGQEIVQAFLIAEELMDQLGLENFAHTVAFGGPNVRADKIDLNNFEPFDEQVGTLMAMYALAYGWGLDVRDIWPVSGSKSDEQTANMRARGKLPADFVNDMTDQLQLKVSPAYLKVEFDFKDDDEDQQQAVIGDIRTRSLERMARTQTLDAESLRRMMFEAGNMSRAEFIRQQHESGKLEDGTPIGVVFFLPDPVTEFLTTIEGIENPLLFEENDRQTVIQGAQVQQSLALEVIAQTTSQAARRKAEQAYAALKWLENQYNTPIALMAEAQGEEEGEEYPDEESEGTEENGGESEQSDNEQEQAETGNGNDTTDES